VNTHAFEESLNYQFIQLAKEHRQRAEEALSQLGLHVSQELVIFVLWREEGLSQSELAARLRVELPTLTKAVQRMERAGLLIRQDDEKDTRVSRVYLTEKGRALYAPALTMWRDLEARMLQGMTEIEQALLRRLLQQMVSNLS
jgi:MarR family transcriptional regulator, organic hydroperoxide resistance regulator